MTENAQRRIAVDIGLDNSELDVSEHIRARELPKNYDGMELQYKQR